MFKSGDVQAKQEQMNKFQDTTPESLVMSVQDSITYMQASSIYSTFFFFSSKFMQAGYAIHNR